MCSRAALCIARSSAILYSALSGFSCTAGVVRHRGVPVAGPRRLLPRGTRARRRTPRRTARARFQQPACVSTPALHRLNARRDRAYFADAVLAGHANRRAPPAVDVFHDHRLDADPDQTIPPVDDFPLAAVIVVRQSLNAATLRTPLLDDPDELQAGSAVAVAARRRWRRLGRAGVAQRRRLDPGAGGGGGAAAGTGTDSARRSPLPAAAASAPRACTSRSAGSTAAAALAALLGIRRRRRAQPTFPTSAT